MTDDMSPQIITPGGSGAADSQPGPDQPPTQVDQTVVDSEQDGFASPDLMPTVDGAELVDDDPSLRPPEDDEAISWTASEFVAHQKSPGWYGILILAAIVGAGIMYVLLKDLVSAAMILIGAIIFGVIAARQPRQLQYQLDSRGVRIGDKYYSLGSFRSFAVVPEGAAPSVVFMPMKRFSPLTTIYFAPEDESRIVDLLTNILPVEEYQHDLVDKFMHRIHF